jgi:hypothetical protein
VLNQTRQAVTKKLVDGDIHKKLVAMLHDPTLNTKASSFSANSTLYPDGQMPFVDKHIAYLMNHPKLDHEQYLANLRLMLKKR